MRLSNTRLPTGPSQDDLQKREKFRKDMKIAFSVVSALTVVVIAVAIYLLVGPGKENT